MNEGTNFLQNYVHDEVASDLSSACRDEGFDFMSGYIHEHCKDLDKKDPMFRLLQEKRIESLRMFEVLALDPSFT